MVPARKGIIMGKISIHDSWKNEPEKFDSMVDFLNWFDGTKSIVDTLLTAQKDWEQRIRNFQDFPGIRKGSCLEIGFGGGRLLVQAGRTFARAIGIDIHDAFDMTRSFLQNQGIQNYKLLHKDDIAHLKDGSIDFIYSFIVFQHFESFEEVNFYLEQIKRLLTDDGMAHIFFGKSKEQGIKTIDAENFETRQCSLFLEPAFFRNHIETMGFKIIEHEDIMKKRLDLPLGPTNESGQARVLFKK